MSWKVGSDHSMNVQWNLILIVTLIATSEEFLECRVFIFEDSKDSTLVNIFFSYIKHACHYQMIRWGFTDMFVITCFITCIYGQTYTSHWKNSSTSAGTLFCSLCFNSNLCSFIVFKCIYIRVYHWYPCNTAMGLVYVVPDGVRSKIG